MKSEQLKRIKNNPVFIPGIYNYCDRWCERCTFTKRCRNYSMNEHIPLEIESYNVTDKIFWKRLEETFKLTLDLLKELALKNKINIDSLDYVSGKHDINRKPGEISGNPIMNLAKTYIEMVDRWFKTEENLFREKESELQLKSDLNIPDYNPEEETARVEEAVKIIHWYQHQIYIKITRAMQSKALEENQNCNQIQNDSNGSAKVALIGIDHSILAWSQLRETLFDQEDKIFNICIYLDRLRKNIEHEFPDARAFIRPGFDEL